MPSYYQRARDEYYLARLNGRSRLRSLLWALVEAFRNHDQYTSD